MSELTLSGVESLLKEGGYDCAVLGDTDSPLGEYLQVFLGVDAAGAEQTVAIQIVKDLLGDPRLKTKVPVQLLKVSFVSELAVEVQDMAVEDVACLLHFINRTMDLPGFELDETRGRVTYRYVHLTPDRKDDLGLVRALVGVVRLFLELFSGAIREVAEGEKSFNDVLDIVVAHLNELQLEEGE
ncbi:MAG: hypothetical protein KDK78_04190 [Chlamydiia bacterium]|nr:hypothetical protein [Chlamydiia bacterium]